MCSCKVGWNNVESRSLLTSVVLSTDIRTRCISLSNDSSSSYFLVVLVLPHDIRSDIDHCSISCPSYSRSWCNITCSIKLRSNRSNSNILRIQALRENFEFSLTNLISSRREYEVTIGICCQRTYSSSITYIDVGTIVMYSIVSMTRWVS